MDFPPLLKNPARADLALLISGCAKPRELIKSSGDFHLIQLMFEYVNMFE